VKEKRRCFSYTSKKPMQKNNLKPTDDGDGKVYNSQLVCSSETILQTLMVDIVASKGSKRIRALLDTGSQRSHQKLDFTCLARRR
jgi:hypothetical protein